MRSVIKSLVFVLPCLYANSQGVYIDNAEIEVQNNASITIQGDLSSENDGKIENEGTVFLRNNLINNGGNTLFTNETSGTVILYGGNQEVLGTDSTVFYNLYFDGGLLTEKSLLISSTVINELDLNNQVMETNDNSLFMMNADPSSVYFNQGFVASNSLGGYFVRATNSTSEYLFPVGSKNLSPNLRLVSVFPLSNDTNYFEARLSPVGGAVDNSGVSNSGAVGPFDNNLKEASLGSINDSYYHNVHQLSGNSSADLDFYWSSNDGDFKTLAQWQSGEYVDAEPEFQIENAFGLDRRMTLKNYSNYNDDVFALAELNIIINIPGGVSVNNDNSNDILIINDLQYYPNNSISIFNRWGDMVFEAAPYQNDWQGQSNVSGTLGGEELSAGTYFYLFQLDEDSEPMKGFIELKR
jgi:gliding motility-associated-like protein